MKKIVFISIRMKDDYSKVKWPVPGNALIEYPESLYFGINGVLARTVNPEDEVFVYPIITNAGDNAGIKNANILKQELESIIPKVKSLKFENIECNFDEDETKFKDLFKILISKLQYDAEITVDITGNTKSIPLLIFSAMQFGEKFFDCSIGNVIYQKVEFKNNLIIENSRQLCDVTPLYLINSFTNTIECPSGEKAIATVEALFEE